jgi:hypothetical protein
MHGDYSREVPGTPAGGRFRSYSRSVLATEDRTDLSHDLGRQHGVTVLRRVNAVDHGAD